MNNNTYLAHYGVLGMKWGVRKDNTVNSIKRYYNKKKKEYSDRGYKSSFSGQATAMYNHRQSRIKNSANFRKNKAALLKERDNLFEGSNGTDMTLKDANAKIKPKMDKLKSEYKSSKKEIRKEYAKDIVKYTNRGENIALGVLELAGGRTIKGVSNAMVLSGHDAVGGILALTGTVVSIAGVTHLVDEAYVTKKGYR